MSNNPHGLGITYEELVKTDLKIKPEAFANEVIKYCKQFLSTNLTNLKLQKLLYYSYAMCAYDLEELPFSVDKIDFWKFGPVIEDIYHEFKNYGKLNLLDKYSDYNKLFIREYIPKEEDFPEYKIEDTDGIDAESLSKIRNNIKYTLECIGNESASQLVVRSHSDESAWKQIYHKKNRPEPVVVIEKIIDEIASYKFFRDIYYNIK